MTRCGEDAACASQGNSLDDCIPGGGGRLEWSVISKAVHGGQGGDLCSRIEPAELNVQVSRNAGTVQGLVCTANHAEESDQSRPELSILIHYSSLFTGHCFTAIADRAWCCGSRAARPRSRCRGRCRTGI